jgi:hypothetical protein
MEATRDVYKVTCMCLFESTRMYGLNVVTLDGFISLRQMVTEVAKRLRHFYRPGALTRPAVQR